MAWNCSDCFCNVSQDRLLNEQKGLQDRLQKALEHRLHPKTSVDTTTVADKIISMFDDMLQASQYPSSSHVIFARISKVLPTAQVMIVQQGMINLCN